MRQLGGDFPGDDFISTLKVLSLRGSHSKLGRNVAIKMAVVGGVPSRQRRSVGGGRDAHGDEAPHPRTLILGGEGEHPRERFIPKTGGRHPVGILLSVVGRFVRCALVSL